MLIYVSTIFSDFFFHLFLPFSSNLPHCSLGHGQDYLQGIAARLFGPEDMRDSSLPAKDLGGENRRLCFGDGSFCLYSLLFLSI